MNPKNSEVMDDDEEDHIVSELTEEDKRTVEKFNRQLSIHSVLSIRSDDNQESSVEGEHEEITEAEALRLQRVIQAFQNHKNTKDAVDGKNYMRLSSSQSYEFLLSSDTAQGSSTSPSESRFVSPGRFHVIFTDESKAIVKEVNELIQRGKNVMRKTKSTEVIVVRKQEYFGQSYYANQDNNASTTKRGNHRYLHPDDIEIRINNPNHYNGRLSNGPSHIGRDFNRENSLQNRNGHATLPPSNANMGFIMVSQLSPKEKFRWAVRRVIESIKEEKKEEKNKKRRDFVEKFWKRRGDVGWWYLLLSLAGPIAFIADSVTDLKVASDHIRTGHPWWGTFTLMLLFFPTILMNIASYFFYKDDEEHAHRKPESGWNVVKISHFLQLGLVERYWRIFIKGYKIKFTKPKLKEVEPYQLYIAMNLDAAMLQMILAFTEDAPQLVLQLYVLIRRKLVERLIYNSLQDIWTMASIFFSFISYSRALVNYMSCLRDSKKNKGQMRWYGYVAMWFWRAFMFTSRVLVLVFFATEYHLWFFLVLAVHLGIILLMTRSHKVCFFQEQDQKGMQVFIRLIVAYIHTFCFFVLDAKKTIRWAVQYYVLLGIEAVVFTTLWFTNSTHYVSLKFELAGMAAIFLCYAMGLVMMVVYYKFLHPKFKRPQTKWYTKAPPKEELCEDVHNEDEEEDEESAGDALQAVYFPGNRATSVKQVELWL